MSIVPHDPQPVTTTTVQHLWETAVCLATTKARAALPHSNGRVDKAQQLVLDGAVEVLDDHTARVTSQRDGETVYYVVNGTCQCRDFPNAPHLMCKHRIARGIAVRAVQIARELGDVQATTASSPQPHIPAEFIVQIQGKPFITFQGLLHLAHQQGLLSLAARFISVTADLAIAEATAMFHDGRTFTEAADATPGNVNSRIKPHFARMALTRAKARCLRDALNLGGLVAVEELD
jgi:hypothetical protein